MKSKFTRILGVVAVIALLASFMAAPVAAKVTQLTVAVDDTEISANSEYIITFTVTDLVPRADGWIEIRFPEGTIIDEIGEYDDGDITIRSTAGFGAANTVKDIIDANVAAVEDPDDVWTVTIGLTDLGVDIGEDARVRITIAADPFLENPPDPGMYSLEVRTSAEDDWVESEEYEIEIPEIPGLPGVVEVYNPSNILMKTFTGEDAIQKALDEAGDNYTVSVGPGTYVGLYTGDDVAAEIVHEGLTLKSTAGADDTTIDAEGELYGILIAAGADEVTVEGFTVEDATGIGIWCMADDGTVQDNVVAGPDPSVSIGIDVAESTTGVTVSGNVIDEFGTMFVHGSDCTISGNTFGESINIQAKPGTLLEGLTITDNTIISAASGIDIFGGTGTYDFEDILIEGNTISEAEGTAGIRIRDNVDSITKLRILNNVITDNEGDGILLAVWAPSNTIKFNNITGNEGDAIQNDTSDDVDATLNWWGTSVAADIADMIKDATDADTDYEPFLAGAAEAVFSAFDVAVGEASIAKDTAGVAVSVDVGDDGGSVDVITVAKYTANPEEAIADAIAFYDVYVAGTFNDADGDSVTIKFYAGDENTEVYLWSADTETWGEVTPVDFSAYGGYIYVTIDDPALLAGTPFALVAAEEAVDEIEKITAPEIGAVDVSVTPTLAWTAVDDAAYEIQISQDASFAKFALGEVATSPTNAYIVKIALAEGESYYWRVRAITDAGAGDWVTGVFTTAAPEPEPTPPIEVVETGPPEITVTMPAATITQAISPALLWAIIGVGAVLVISLIVLIVRTRRAV